MTYQTQRFAGFKTRFTHQFWHVPCAVMRPTGEEINSIPVWPITALCHGCGKHKVTHSFGWWRKVLRVINWVSRNVRIGR